MIIEAKSPVESLLNESTGVWSSLNNQTSSKQARTRRQLRELLDKSDKLALYENLSDFLADGNSRFSLYCPFNILPHVSQKQDPIISKFIRIFTDSWIETLADLDIEADFVDGDLPDSGYPKTTIQGHKLEKELIKLGYLASTTPYYDLYNRHEEYKTTTLEDLDLPWIIDMRNAYQINKLVERTLNDCKPNLRNVKENRSKWLVWDHRRKSINRFANKTWRYFEYIDIPNIKSLTNDSIQAVATTIGRAIENGTKSNKFIPFLKEANGICDLTGVICRLYHAGLIDKKIVEEFGIFVPSIDGDLYKNLEPVRSEIEKYKSFIYDSRLSSLIYPVFIAYGSRLKGYNGKSSDLDIAVFVRPGVINKQNVSDSLRSVFGFDVSQYWLNYDNKNLIFQSFSKPDPFIIDDLDSHVLLNGIWFGEESALVDLANNLVSPYVYDSRSEIRKIRVKQMERDILLYRLLHRGYETMFKCESEPFFDNGYRMVASKLFTTHVFIPS